MSKTNQRSGSNNGGFSKQARAETISYRQVFEWISQTVPFEIGLIVSTMPRGGLQIVQPQRIHETMARAYSKQFHRDDKITWSAILEERAVHGLDVWGSAYSSTPFVSEFMQSIGLNHVAAAPLRAPV